MTKLDTITCSDCRDWLKTIPDDSVDACVTDPPYDHKSWHLYQWLFTNIGRVLRPGGSLLAIMPHWAVGKIEQEMPPPLRFRWLLAMWQGMSRRAQLCGIGVQVTWKPILWAVKGTRPTRGTKLVPDGFASKPSDLTKGHHKWEQPISWATYCLKFVTPGGTVLDPLAGSGTVCVAAIQEGFHFLACEKDQGYVNIAQARIEATERKS